MNDEPGQIRLLYIDDDPALRRLVEKTLGRAGIEVVAAASGDEGLSILAEQAIDVIALDHFMPDRDGLEVLDAIQALPVPPPVVYVTGASEGRIAVAAMKAGAADYVVKDVGGVFIDLLKSAIDAALEARRLTLAQARAEAEIRASRDRAEMLLKEVNHRVANSLQLVGSLVAMQQRGVTDPAAREALAETQGRIAAIAQIHRRLYTSDDVTTVELDAYLAGLAGELEAAMSASGRSHRLLMRVAPIRVATDKAVPIGVVVTELVTNAFKYAYPTGASGEIRVALEQAGEQLELRVEDDGVGVSPEAAVKGSGLGMRVVRAMLDALKSSLEVDGSPPGTRLVMRFAPNG